VTSLTHILHITKLSPTLKQLTYDSLKAFSELNSELVIETLTDLGLTENTINLDGMVISTNGIPTWSFEDYNPIKRGDRSHFLLTVHMDETIHVL